MTTKSEQTREALVETALAMFREHGYEKTTMRAIAAEAGVSQGNAYYYFDGKDALVQQLYLRLQAEHRDAALAAIRDGAPLADNLCALWRAGIDVMEPYHGFGSTLLTTALQASSGTSPLSGASAQARDDAIGLVADVLGRSKGVPGGALRRQLPMLLWLVYLGVTPHLGGDDSEQRARTMTLIDGVAPILARMLMLARLPVGCGLVADITALVEKLAPTGSLPTALSEPASRTSSTVRTEDD